VPRLFVIYDPKDRLSGLNPEQMKRMGAKEAILTIGESSTPLEISETARQLAELLLSNLDELG
jgi:hypothetical protein